MVNTPIHDYAIYPRYESTHTAPLGLLSIATFVREHGFTARVLDAEYLQCEPEQIADLYERLKPSWVGLNSFSVNISVLQKVVDALLRRGARVLLGGPHITNTSDTHLRRWFAAAELAIRGDGESSVRDLLAGAALSSIPGAVDLRTNTPAQAPVNLDLSDLPIIDRSLSEGEPVARFDRQWFNITMSRGCVFRCRFCAGSSHSNGLPYRVAGPDRTYAELAYLRDLGGTGIRLVDDLPFKGKRSLFDFLAGVAREFKGQFVWDINFPLQYCLTLTGEDWQELASLGVGTLTFGVEAADEQLRTWLGKRSTDVNLLRTLDHASAAGIDLKLYFIVGTPGEIATASRATVDLAIRLAKRKPTGAQVRCSVFVYKPMPGSALWQDLMEQGYDEESLLSYTDFELEVSQFQKHAWQSTLWLAELPPHHLAELVDHFYAVTEKDLPDTMRPTHQPLELSAG